jgi:hypothetical protein
MKLVIALLWVCLVLLGNGCDNGHGHWSYQKRVTIAPGVRLNVSKSGVGVSAGVPGARGGVDSKGRTYSSMGVPGSGVRYVERHGSKP